MFRFAPDSRVELISPSCKVRGEGILDADVVYSTNSSMFLLPDLVLGVRKSKIIETYS